MHAEGFILGMCLILGLEDAAIDRQLKDLGSPHYSVREKAQTDLCEYGDPHLPKILKTLATSPCYETRARAGRVVGRLYYQRGEKAVECLREMCGEQGLPKGYGFHELPAVEVSGGRKYAPDNKMVRNVLYSSLSPVDPPSDEILGLYDDEAFERATVRFIHIMTRDGYSVKDIGVVLEAVRKNCDSQQNNEWLRVIE